MDAHVHCCCVAGAKYTRLKRKYASLKVETLRLREYLRLKAEEVAKLEEALSMAKRL
jgi:hypothetical protein